MTNDELKKAGLKATLPRLKILQYLEQNPQRHMSAEEVYKAMVDAGEDVGLATIYRVLTQFEQAELVTRHRFEGGQAFFELKGGMHHDHIRCMRCGRVDEFMDETIEARQHAIAERLGYSMTDHSLCIFGICSACRDSK